MGINEKQSGKIKQKSTKPWLALLGAEENMPATIKKTQPKRRGRKDEKQAEVVFTKVDGRKSQTTRKRE